MPLNDDKVAIAAQQLYVLAKEAAEKDALTPSKSMGIGVGGNSPEEMMDMLTAPRTEEAQKVFDYIMALDKNTAEELAARVFAGRHMLDFPMPEDGWDILEILKKSKRVMPAEDMSSLRHNVLVDYLDAFNKMGR